MVIHFEAQIAY